MKGVWAVATLSDVASLAARNAFRAPLRAALTLGGIAIGAAFFSLLLALAAGTETAARAEILGDLDLRTVTVTPGNSALTPEAAGRLTNETVTAIGATVGVVSVRREVDVPLSVVTAHGNVPARLRGVEPDSAAGRRFVGKSDEVVLLPPSLSRLLGADAGQSQTATIVVQAQRLMVSSSGGASLISVGGPLELRVIGSTDEERGSLDLIAPLGTGLRLAAAANGSGAQPTYSRLQVVAENPRRAVELAEGLQRDGYGATALQETVNRLEAGFVTVRVVLGTIGVIALLVAALGVANTMLMAVVERTKEIGLLSAIGASPGFIRLLLLLEAGVIGVVGAVCGLAAGLLLGLALDPLLRQILEGFGGALPTGQLFEPSLEIFALVAFVVVAISLLAAWLPVRRATRMQPVDALRYD